MWSNPEFCRIVAGEPFGCFAASFICVRHNLQLFDGVAYCDLCCSPWEIFDSSSAPSFHCWKSHPFDMMLVLPSLAFMAVSCGLFLATRPQTLPTPSPTPLPNPPPQPPQPPSTPSTPSTPLNPLNPPQPPKPPQPPRLDKPLAALRQAPSTSHPLMVSVLERGVGKGRKQESLRIGSSKIRHRKTHVESSGHRKWKNRVIGSCSDNLPIQEFMLLCPVVGGKATTPKC